MTQVQLLPKRTVQSPEERSDRRAQTGLRIAYLSTEYPKVSHTFIRREILELERRGHEIMRLAIRDSVGAVADHADACELEKTIVCLSRPKMEFAAALAWTVITRPLHLLKASRVAIKMSRVSDRGLIRHIAYLVEAMLLTRLLIRRRISHVHVHFGTNSATVARLIRLLGGPSYSMTVHGPDEFDAPRGFSLGEKVADAEFVVAISDYCGAQLRRWAAPEHWDKIHAVHCTVGEEYFANSVPIYPKSKTIACVGRLSAQKGHLLLLDAARQLIESGIDFRLVLAGDGELRREIESRINELNLASQVEITGWLDEAQVRRLICESRVIVQPSFAEGLPVVLMESMALRRPVIATTIAGIPELVEDEINGWLIPAGNIDALSEAMRFALQSKSTKLDEMGDAGHERVRQRHRTSTEVDKLETLLTSVVGKTGGR